MQRRAAGPILNVRICAGIEQEEDRLFLTHRGRQVQGRVADAGAWGIEHRTGDQGALHFLHVAASRRLKKFRLGLLSLFAGLYSVPMYALIQLRAQPTHRARIIAANNILNALFMIASSVIAGALLKAGFTIPQVFLFTGIANAVVAGYIFLLVPEYLLRFVAWVATHLVYRFRVRGEEHIPTTGAALLVCNHVSFVDAVLLMAASPRPIHFVMDHRIFRVPVLGLLFRLAKAIPIASRQEDGALYEAAFERAAQVLREGDLLAIFPEGGITHDGTLQEFRGGLMKILERARADGLDVPVIVASPERALQIFPLGLPVVLEFLHTGLVPRLPTAVLATGLVLLSFLAFVCGLILDSVTRGRREMKRLAYLAIPSLAARSLCRDAD